MAKHKTNGKPVTNGHVNNVPPILREPPPGAPRGMTTEEVTMNRWEKIVNNVTTLQRGFLQQFWDRRKDVDAECGYPQDTSYAADKYQQLFDREPVANRVVQLLPKESWQVQPMVYEDEDPNVVTPFEQAWDDLARQLRGGSMYQDEEGNPIWEYLLRADVLSGIGQFGVILIGIDDGKQMSEPVDGVTDGSEELKKEKGEGELDKSKPKTLFTSRGTDEQYNTTSSFAVPTGKPEEDEEPVDDGQQEESDDHAPSSLFEGEEADEVSDDGETPKKTKGNEDSKKRKLLFLRVFGENLAQITRFETNQQSPRFGLPVMYKITLNDPRAVNSGIGLSLATVDVHWSRVIHVNDSHETPSTSEWASPPRMQPVLNRLMDIRKISGAAGEGFWKNAFPILVMESNPAMSGDVDIGDVGRLRDNIENVEQSLQRSLVTVGFQAKLLPPTVTDPTPFVENCIVQICIKMGVPIRVFKGSERGELASSQDDATWNDRLKLRQCTYITPKIIIPFIDRLIAMGVLPKPKQGKRSIGQLAKAKLKGDEAAKPPGGDLMAEGAPAPDGFGGKPKPGGGAFGKGPPKPAFNAFCPTGEGGGLDNSCSSSSGAFGTDDPYVYHATGKNVPLNKFVKGIVPSETGLDGKAVYLSNREESTYQNVDKSSSRMMRIDKAALIKKFGVYPKNPKGVQFDDMTGDITLHGGQTIPMEMIEVRIGSKFKRLSDVRGLTRNEKKLLDEAELDPALDQDEGESALTEDIPDGKDPLATTKPGMEDQTALGIERQEEKTTPGYSVEWPDIDSMTKLEKAQIFNQRVTAWAAYTAGGVDQIIPPDHAMTELDDMDEEEAAAILASAVQHNEEVAAEQALMLEEHGFEPDPTNPDAMIDPDQQEAENEIELAKAENPAGVQQSNPFEKGPPGAGGPPGKKPPFVKNEETTDNVFCPTGEGGGVDPSCPPSGGGESQQPARPGKYTTGKKEIKSTNKPGTDEPHEQYEILHDGQPIGKVSSYTGHKDTKSAGNKYVTSRKDVVRWSATVNDGAHRMVDVYKKDPTTGKMAIQKGPVTQGEFKSKKEAMEFVEKNHRATFDK